MTCGVPQGSTLGPLLFLIYINDSPNCLNYSKSRMYADDTNLTLIGTSLKTVQEKTNCELDNVKQWLLANKLSLNVTKTDYMIELEIIDFLTGVFKTGNGEMAKRRNDDIFQFSIFGAKIRSNPALHENIPLNYIVNPEVSIRPTVARLSWKRFISQ